MKHNGQREFEFAPACFTLRGQRQEPQTPRPDDYPTEEEKRQAQAAQETETTKKLKELII